MFEIKSDTKSKTLDVKICGYTTELIQEFGAIIRTVCANFISKAVEENSRKAFAERLALVYAKEVHSAYLETLNDSE